MPRLASQFATFNRLRRSSVWVRSGPSDSQSAGTKRKICTTRFLLCRIEARRIAACSSRRIAARLVSAWLGPLGAAWLGSGRREAGRRGDGLGRGGTGRGQGSHSYFTKCILPTQTNFDKVKTEILRPTK